MNPPLSGPAATHARMALELLGRLQEQRSLPLDRLLADHFRANPRCGSKDRRTIADTLHGILRWQAWLPPLPSVAFKSREPLMLPGVARHLALAWILDAEPGAEPTPSISRWLELAELSRPPSLHGSLLSRRRFLEGLGLSVPPDEALLPKVLWDCMPALTEAERTAFILSQQERPPLWLRVQNADPAAVISQLRQDDCAVRSHPRLPSALAVLGRRPQLRESRLWMDGLIEVQDICSQAVALAAAPKPGQRWWDLCAGAGGKTLHLAALTGDQASIFATDLRPAPLEELRQRASRAGYRSIRTGLRQEGSAAPAQGFDAVLVDAPCSCSGTWRRHPSLRWSLTLKEIQSAARTQLRLLHLASTAIRPGGLIIYATCSLSRQENEDAVAAFLQDHPDFSLEPFIAPLSGSPCTGQLRLWPQHHDGDALFVARLRQSRSDPAP